MSSSREEWEFKDGKCIKLLIFKGKLCERPKENATCQLKIRVKEGAHIQCVGSEYLKEDFDGKLIVGYADCEVDRQIEKCVRSMVMEEECVLTLSFKEFPSSVVLEILLSSFAQFPDIYKWSKEEKLDIAKEHKQKGVQLFQMGRLRDAFLRFNKSVKLLITLGIEDDAEAKSLYVQACNNMSWCHLKADSTAHALTLCNKVLNIEPDNVKALLRRSECYTRLNDNDLAVMDLQQVRKLEPSNGVARERLISLQHRLEIENIKYANVIKRMFQ